MIRTGDEYRESIRDGRQVWINGEQFETARYSSSACCVVGE